MTSRQPGAGSAARLEIADAHHHIWRLDRTLWLSAPMSPRIFGPYQAIRRDYGIGDYAADAGPSGVTRSVHVQANVAPRAAAEEVAWAAACAVSASSCTGIPTRPGALFPSPT
jgi:predicted TIM-barrel fold metal-dependent hydrolase